MLSQILLFTSLQSPFHCSVRYSESLIAVHSKNGTSIARNKPCRAILLQNFVWFPCRFLFEQPLAWKPMADVFATILFPFLANVNVFRVVFLGDFSGSICSFQNSTDASGDQSRWAVVEGESSLFSLISRCWQQVHGCHLSARVGLELRVST